MKTLEKHGDHCLNTNLYHYTLSHSSLSFFLFLFPVTPLFLFTLALAVLLLSLTVHLKKTTNNHIYECLYKLVCTKA